LSEVIRLSLALAVGPRADLIGFALGLLMVAGVGLLTAMNTPIGPATPTDGVVLSLNLTRRAPRALVDVHGDRVIVRHHALRQCRIGDRIPLERRKAPIGVRFTVPFNACAGRR